MDPHELQEHTEHAHHSGEKGVGLTMAVVAVLLAIATLLSHRAHTEEVVLKGDANDQWAYYQAKNVRVHMYEADAKLAALLPAGKDLASEFKEAAKVEREGVPAKNDKPAKDGAEKIQERAKERDAETMLEGQRANYYDGAELFLEVSIVLCSIALLAENRMYWKLSFLSTAVGIVVAVWGLLLR
ncbi:MAG TPA: DUF4337 domain-containing protein [Candidatus Angelobacter sp.]|nr:DUF4337 domain-containing protein [Candidatus Angelobacter sp.]